MHKINILFTAGSLALLISVSTLLGCAKHESELTPGQVTLTYLGISDSDVQFVLANGLDRTISLRGSRTPTLAIRSSFGEAGLWCENASESKREEAPMGFADGGLKYIDIPPAQTARIVIYSPLAKKFAGGTCRLNLMLKDGTVVGPVEFHP